MHKLIVVETERPQESAQSEWKSTTHYGNNLKPFLIIKSDGVKSYKKDDRRLW